MSSISSYLPNHKIINTFLNDPKLALMSAVALGTVAYSVYSNMKKDNNQEFSSIPMPKGNYPIVGHIPHLASSPQLKMQEWHEELGPIVHIKMGVKDFILISDPKLAHKIFITNGNVTSSRPPHAFITEYYSHGGRGILFGEYGKQWIKARTAATTFLAPKVVDEFKDMLFFEAENFVKVLMEQTKSMENYDPFENIKCFSLNVVLSICCGTRVDSPEDPIYKEIIDAVEVLSEKAGFKEDISSFIPALYFLEYISGKHKRNNEWIYGSRDPTMRKLLKKVIESDADSILKKMYASDDKAKWDEKDFIVILNDMFAAGTEATAVTIARTFLFLSNHAEFQKKICDEIDAFILKYGRLPDFSEREHFPYMISFQREMLRSFPVNSLGAPHFANEDFIVDNYLIKKGSTLLSNMYSMHKNPEFYPKPDSIIPERFIDNDSTMYASANGNTNDRDIFMFGWGRRICPGIYLIEMELFYVYVNLWSRCTVEPMLDSNDNPVYANYNETVNIGLGIFPVPHELRFVERPDKLL